MTKFNVGDKVRFIEDYMDYKKGDTVEVIGFWDEGINYIGKGKSTGCYFSRVELVETKPTKNQRITALEDTVAKQSEEISELKLIVHELRNGRETMRDVMHEVLSEPSTTTVEDIIEFEGQQYKKVDREACEGDVVMFTVNNNHYQSNKSYKVIRDVTFTDDNGKVIFVYNNLKRTPENVVVYELIQSKQLTPNQQRAAIIVKAKDFIVKSKFANKFYEVPNGPFGYFHCDVEFIVNEQKRTVVALMRSTNNKSIKAKGIAKCMPDDVFNKYIGKAIALGRALGLDVSEFEQAVQPNEVVLGHIIVWNESPDEPHEVVTKNGDWFDFIYLKDNKRYNNHEYCEIERFTTILNDTNAIY